jgi:hypothetical protein
MRERFHSASFPRNAQAPKHSIVTQPLPLPASSAVCAQEDGLAGFVQARSKTRIWRPRDIVEVRAGSRSERNSQCHLPLALLWSGNRIALWPMTISPKAGVTGTFCDG